MRFFQQSQAKVHGQKPLPCTKTNKTYLAKHPSTYFFIGSQMVGFHGTSTYRVHRVSSTVATRGINFGILIKIPQNVELDLP